MGVFDGSVGGNISGIDSRTYHMKIALISNLYPPMSRGGAERVAQRIAQELHTRGHDICVISTMPFDGRASLYPRLREVNVERIYRFYPKNLYYILDDFRFPYPIRAFWHLIDLYSRSAERAVEIVLTQERPDIVLTHNLKGISLRIPQAVQRLQIPWIHTIHDVQLSVPSGLLFYDQDLPPWEQVLRSWYERTVRHAFGQPNVVISPSRFLADFYHARGFFHDSDIQVIPNPAPTSRAAIRQSRLSGPIRLLFAGQLEKHKGVLELVSVLDNVSLPIELHFAGEGTLASFIAERSHSDARITYHGFVSEEPLQHLLRIMDAVVVPSLCYENSPTIIYESLQAGVPVIASDIGGVGELIHHGENGLLVRPADPKALVQAIQEFGDQVDQFWARTSKIRASVSDYSIERYLDRLEEIMHELVSNS